MLSTACAQDQHINIVPTEYNGVASIFLQGATFVMQKQLEVNLNFEFKTDVNGLRGHIIAADTFDKPALLAVLALYGFTFTDYM